MPKIQTVVLPWYREEDYGRWLCSCSDAYLLPRTYHEWHEAAQRALQETQAQGAIVVKVYVESNDFFRWCLDRELMPDARARQHYAEMLAKQHVDRAAAA